MIISAPNVVALQEKLSKDGVGPEDIRALTALGQTLIAEVSPRAGCARVYFEAATGARAEMSLVSDYGTINTESLNINSLPFSQTADESGILPGTVLITLANDRIIRDSGSNGRLTMERSVAEGQRDVGTIDYATGAIELKGLAAADLGTAALSYTYGQLRGFRSPPASCIVEQILVYTTSGTPTSVDWEVHQAAYDTQRLPPITSGSASLTNVDGSYQATLTVEKTLHSVDPNGLLYLDLTFDADCVGYAHVIWRRIP